MAKFTDRFAGRVVGQRECPDCGFSGPETEFIARSRHDDGMVVLVPLADGPEGSESICVGCASAMGRINADLLGAFIRDFGGLL